MRAQPALQTRQTATVALLFCGYAAYYFCRADLSVATPLIAEEMRQHGAGAGEALVAIGSMSSLGVLAYALGKLLLTGMGDLWGGRRSFLTGLAGATAFTLLFTLGGSMPIFTLAWIGNRLTQSIGWAGLLKVCSKWFNYTSYGTIVGILSLSYLVGDAVARQSMGALLRHGYGWREIFLFAGAVAGTMLLANLLLLRESRVQSGYPEATANPLNLFGNTDERPANLWALLKPLLASRAFGLVCVLSLGCTIVRETFNTWTPAYLHDALGYAAPDAASASAIFPAVGAASVLVTGWISDRAGPYGRPFVLTAGLAASAVALALLAAMPAGGAHAMSPLLLIASVAFFLLGPYSTLGGAFALDFGGKQAGSASSGIIDGVGYLGGVLAGDSVARILVSFGWTVVFTSLAAVCALSALAAGWLFMHQRQRTLDSGA